VKTLFVCGTPRSGTTLLARIIGAHSKVVLGIERFKYHYAKDTLDPTHFAPDRYIDYRAEDTDHKPSLDLAIVRKKFDHAVLVGDKYPTLYRSMPYLAQRFQGSHFIFIIRNPYEVAMSWQARAENLEDSWSDGNDALASVAEWNAAIQAAISAAKAGIPVHFVNYGLLTNYRDASSVAEVEAIFRSLDLAIDEGVRAQYLREMRTSINRTEARRKPDHALMQEIARKLDTGMFQEFMQISDLNPVALLTTDPIEISSPLTLLKVRTNVERMFRGRRVAFQVSVENLSSLFPIRSRGRDRQVIQVAWTDAVSAEVVAQAPPILLRVDVPPNSTLEQEIRLTVPAEVSSAILILTLGDSPPTNRPPAACSKHAFNAEDLRDVARGRIELRSACVSFVAGERTSLNVCLHNQSKEAWPAKGSHPCRIIWRWTPPDTMKDTTRCEGRSALRSDLAPGQSVDLKIDVQAPDTAGEWTLEFSAGLAGMIYFDSCEAFVPSRSPVMIRPRD